MVRATGLEPACLTTYEPKSYVSANSTTPAYSVFMGRNRNPMRLPVAVPDIFVGGKAPSSSVDRCHALSSLHPPPAALASLPNSTTSAYLIVGAIMDRPAEPFCVFASVPANTENLSARAVDNRPCILQRSYMYSTTVQIACQWIRTERLVYPWLRLNILHIILCLST